VQRGTDILKGLAMGADAVAIGKPYLYGLCAGGEDGAAKAIEVLSVELERAMGLLGVGTVRELRARMAAGEELVRRRQPSPRDFPDRGALDRGYGGGVF
jgi:isopentenyl diphosphate isomerase/L-lactate dehydrogenase-like FMN-dependent dehydrogenase